MNFINKFYSTKLIKTINKTTLDTFWDKKIYGINITVPHKIEIIKHLYKISDQTTKIGSVNTLKYTKYGYVGYNTDITGIEDAFIEQDISMQDKNILIIGSGGSAYTACFTACKNNAGTLTISNRTMLNAQNLKQHIQRYYDIPINICCIDNINNVKNIDIVINTTTLGFGQNIGKSPISPSFFSLNDVLFVFDIIYTPKETELLKIARTHNIKCINGFPMLVYQALESEKIWTDIDIPNKYKISLKNKLEKLIVS